MSPSAPAAIVPQGAAAAEIETATVAVDALVKQLAREVAMRNDARLVVHVDELGRMLGALDVAWTTSPRLVPS